MSRRLTRLRIPLSALALTVYGTVSMSQTPTSCGARATQRDADSAQAENRWRLTPVNLQTQQDPVPPDTRAARNAAWKPPAEKIWENPLNSPALATHTHSLSEPEVDKEPHTGWVIATFDRYLVVPIDGNPNLLYTEIHFAVKELIGQSDTAPIGSSFDVDFVGGRVKTSTGRVYSYGVYPERYFVQPGHTYLLQLLSMESGDIYGIYKQWDVTSGRVAPDRDDLVLRGSLGQSKLNGMPVTSVSGYVQSILSGFK